MDERALRFVTLDLPEGGIEARLAWARRQGRPGWVWPEVTTTSWRAALAVLERTVRARLAGAGRVVLEGSAESGAPLAVAAFSSGLGPLLGRWIEDGSLACDPELAGLLRLHLEHGRLRWERLSAVATSAATALADAGLDPVLIKGVHTAATLFPEPGARLCNDVDVVVPRRDWSRARGALEGAGFRLLTAQVRIGRAELLAPGEGDSVRSLYLLHRAAPIRVDLHAGLDRVYFGAAHFALGDPEPGETAPWPPVHPAARALRDPLLTILLAAHASEGLPNLTLLRMVELVLAVRAGERAGALDWDALLERARRAGGFRFVFPAFELAERLAPGTVPGAVRRTLRAGAPPAMRMVVDALEPATTQRVETLSLAERVMWAGSLGELAGRLGDMLWPASAGGSSGRVARIYGERMWRLVRGRVGG